LLNYLSGIGGAKEFVSRSDDIQAADLMNWLGRFDYVHGAYNSAESLWRRECELRRTILGLEHPNTLTSMNNLALTLGAQGDLEGARKIHEQVLEITRRVLGEEHPNTSVIAWNLFSTCLETGDSDGANTIFEDNLIWLLDRNPESLGAVQLQIRDMILQMLHGADQPE
jgi:tetratricopeptide (TPR) repeat protein